MGCQADVQAGRSGRLRFGLRTVLLVVTLLGVVFAIVSAHIRLPPNQVNKATLDRLVARVKPGMTVAEVSNVFGFDRDPLGRELGAHEDGDPTWTFYLTDPRTSRRHGGMVFYIGKFFAGKLTSGGLFYPM